jgi:hypothetical protein
MSQSSAKQQTTNKNGVTVLSLDDFSKIRQLHLGETAEIASGVSLSMLRQASEALLEIDQNAPSKVTVDSISVNEITTIHPGQIVKTGEGRFVMVRPLQSLILKHEVGTRPTVFQNAIDLAVASLINRDMMSEKAASITNQGLPSVEEAKPESKLSSKISESMGISTHAQGFVLSKQLLIALAVLILGLIGMTLWSVISIQNVKSAQSMTGASNDTQNSSSKVSSPDSKDNKESKADLSNDPLNLGRFSKSKKTDVKVNEFKPIENKPELAAIPKNFNPDEKAATPVSNTKKPSVNAKKTSDTSSAAKNPYSRDTLSATDRQTILEYKLEARFDRSNARAKLKHFAESFPKGSRARQEVMKSYSDL